MNETFKPTAEENASTMTLIKRCPFCGDRMHQETDEFGILMWVCNTPEPDCGYSEPV